MRADVLYDSTAMTDDSTWNTTRATMIGGAILFGHDIDIQAADDFALTESYIINSVTGDYVASPGKGSPPASGVLVEFFEDLSGTPSETPSFAVLSTAVTAVPLPDLPGPDFRITIDLSSDDITLDPGTWWLSITPFDDTGEGSAFFQIARTAGKYGNNTHVRDGGEDHGNGLPGLWGFDDWTLPFEDSGDLAMKIEGTPVEPACPWDVDDNGSIGVSDLLSLLASWGPCKECPADFDSDGNVGVSDLLALLANWGLCP